MIEACGMFWEIPQFSLEVEENGLFIEIQQDYKDYDEGSIGGTVRLNREQIPLLIELLTLAHDYTPKDDEE